MAIGSYISKSKASMLYILNILRNRTDHDHPLKQNEIQKILAGDPYNMDLNRDTIEATLLELQQYFDEAIVCNSSEKNDGSEYKTGWYFNRPGSERQINELIAHLNISNLPDEAAEEIVGLLKSAKSGNYLDSSIANENRFYSKQHSLSKNGADNYLKINEIINTNRRDPVEEVLIDFQECYKEIEDGKIVLKKKISAYKDVLPITIVEWNYRRILICCNDVIMFHVDLDLIRNIRKKKVKKTRNKKIRSFLSKVATSEKIREYINSRSISDNDGDNIYLFNDENIYRVKLRLNRKDIWREGINGFLNEYPDGFKILSSDKDYHYVEVKTSLLKLLSVLIAHYNQIEVVSPDGIREAMRLELKVYGHMLLNDDHCISRINIVRNKEYKTEIDYDVSDYSLAEICCTIEQINLKEEWTYREYSGIYNWYFYDGTSIEEAFERYLLDQGFQRITISKDNDGFYSERYTKKEEIDELLKGFYRDPMTDYEQGACYIPLYLSTRFYEKLLSGKRVNYDQRYGITSRSNNDMMQTPGYLDPYETYTRITDPHIDHFAIDDYRLRVSPTLCSGSIRILSYQQLQILLNDGIDDDTLIVSILREGEKPLKLKEEVNYVEISADGDPDLKQKLDLIRSAYGYGMDVIFCDENGKEYAPAVAAALREYFEEEGETILKDSRYKTDKQFYELLLEELKK